MDKDNKIIKFILLQQIVILIASVLFCFLGNINISDPPWKIFELILPDLVFCIVFNMLFFFFQYLKKILNLRSKRIINYFILVIISYVLTYLFSASITTYPRSWTLGYFLQCFYYEWWLYIPLIIFMLGSEFLFNKIFNNTTANMV